MTKALFIDQDIPLGTKYIDRRGRECKVVDIYKTYNAVNELIQTRYAVEYLWAGVILKDRDVVKVTIQRALMSAEKD